MKLCVCVCVCVGGGASVTQHAKRMRRIRLPSVACPALPYFSTLYHKRYDFLGGKKFIEHKMCVLIFSTTFVWNISHSKKKKARYYHKCSQVFKKSTHYSCQILMKSEFSQQTFKISTNLKFHENPSSESRVVPCGRRDRQTWRSLMVAFRNFEHAPKNL